MYELAVAESRSQTHPHVLITTGISSVNPDQRVTGLKDIDDYHVIMKI